MLNRLNDFSSNTPIDSLVQTYSILSTRAKQASCHSPYTWRFIKDHILYKDVLIQLQEFIYQQNLVTSNRSETELTIGECMQSAIEKNSRLALENTALRKDIEEVFEELLQDVLDIDNQAVVVFDQESMAGDCSGIIEECLHSAIRRGNRLAWENVVLKKKRKKIT